MEYQQSLLDKVEEMFLKYGIKSITMDDISKELGISKKTLYQFVENKADLIDKIILQFIQAEKDDFFKIHSTAKDPIEELLLVAKHVVQHFRKLRPTAVYDLKKYYRKSWDKMEKFHGEFVHECIKQNILIGIEQGIYRAGIDPEVIAKFYGNITFAIVDESSFPSKQFNREHLFDQYIFYHINGIASQKGIKLLEKHLSNENKKSTSS